MGGGGGIMMCEIFSWGVCCLCLFDPVSVEGIFLSNFGLNTPRTKLLTAPELQRNTYLVELLQMNFTRTKPEILNKPHPVPLRLD